MRALNSMLIEEHEPPDEEAEADEEVADEGM